jgi:hypothetical protein
MMTEDLNLGWIKKGEENITAAKMATPVIIVSGNLHLINN